MSETCPIFLIEHDQIQEVYYTEWIETSPGAWRLKGDVKLVANLDGNRLVVELPVGCFEIPIYPVRPGDSVSLQAVDDMGVGMVPCVSPRTMVVTETPNEIGVL